MAADFAMDQFRLLVRLLVHGERNYHWMSYMILYNFYRNAIFCACLILGYALHRFDIDNCNHRLEQCLFSYMHIFSDGPCWNSWAFFHFANTKLFWACLVGVTIGALVPRFVVKVFVQNYGPNDIQIAREAEKNETSREESHDAQIEMSQIFFD